MTGMKIIVDRKYRSLESYVEQLPVTFDTGELVYAARNVLRRFCWDGTVVVVKKYKIPILLNRFVYGRFRKSKARRSFEYARILSEKGFRTPQAVAYIEERHCRLLSDSYLVTLNEDFPELSDTYRVVSLNNDLYWFIRNSEYVLLGYESGRFQLKQRIPFTLFDNPTIEDRGNIYVASDGTSYFCLNGGIARYDRYRNYVDTTRVPLSLSQVRAYNRHENEFAPLPCKGADAPEAGASVLSYSYNTILFKFSYPDFTGRRFLIYYKLDGFDNEWIEGTSNFQRTYSNLPYGNFVLHAVVKDDRGKELSSLSYPFKIERPFYSSWWALIIYFALFLCILVVLVRMYTMWIVMREKKVNEEQKRLQEEQLRAQEQLIVKLENEKLENDLTYKSKELASATLSVISHNDFLEGLKKEIQAQQLSGSYTKRFFDKLIRMIEENISGEDEWAIFQTNFDRIHEKFFTNLKERYPDLTPGDLRLCALLRLNMPTKDMARMQNLSVRGIEAARYRLRKKLNLPEGQSLVDFMIQFH